MTAVPDTAEPVHAHDHPAHARRPLLSGGFWVMMIFCALCLAAAVGVVVLGPRLAPVTRVVAAAAPITPPPAAALATVAVAPPPSLSGPPADTALAGRVQALEANQARIAHAAAAALAAASLSDAAARSTPFSADLAAVARLLPNSPDALALAAVAGRGAPTTAALAGELSSLGAQVSTAARAPGRNASFMDRAIYAFSRVVTVRRIDDHATGADATLARAEHAADEGDLAAALTALDALPPAAQTTLAPWREAAQRRIEIDRHIAGLRAQAEAELAAAQGGAT